MGQLPQEQDQDESWRNRENVAEIEGAEKISGLAFEFQAADGAAVVHGEVAAPQRGAIDRSLAAAGAKLPQDSADGGHFLVLTAGAGPTRSIVTLFNFTGSTGLSP